VLDHSAEHAFARSEQRHSLWAEMREICEIVGQLPTGST